METEIRNDLDGITVTEAPESAYEKQTEESQKPSVRNSGKGEDVPFWTATFRRVYTKICCFQVKEYGKM